MDASPDHTADRPGRGSGQRRGQRRWVEVDEFGDPVPLTPDQRTKLTERAMNLCVWHLGRGPRTEHELRQAMTRKGVPEDLCATVLSRLREVGYVNDAAFADSFVRSRHENQRKGARVIRMELQRKGVDSDTAAAALEQVTEESEREQALALVVRKLPGTRGLEPRKRVNRLVGALARRGYSPGMAYQVVAEALATEDD